MVFETLAKTSIFSYDTANNTCMKDAYLCPQRGASRETVMNRINARGEFVNDSQVET
jgi:hypothetical protein